MKKKIILVFSLFSLVFLAGGIYIIYTVERATSKLDRLITLHQVEILREHLLLSIKNVQSDIALRDTRHARKAGTTLSDLQHMKQNADTCFDCHHSEKISAKLVDLTAHIAQYRKAVGRLLKGGAGTPGAAGEEDAAFAIGEELTGKVNAIIAISSSNVERKTQAATDEIAATKRILFVLIGIGPLLATGLTFLFIAGFTRPVDVLLKAIRRIESGDLNVRIEGLRDEFGEVAGSFNEMTASLQVQLYRLEESEMRYRTLFESAKDAIFIIDAEGQEPGKIVAANHAAAEMHGYTVEELKAMNIADLDAPEEASRIPERIAQILRGEWITAEISHRRRDGSLFPVEVSAGVIELGSRRYLLAFDRDISDRRQAQLALQRAEQMRLVGELAAGLAHEIKNPLAGIKVSIDVLVQEIPLSPEDRQVFLGVRNELKMIELLIKSLLNFAKPPKPQLAAVNINTLLDTIMSLSLKNPAFSHIEVRREYQRDLPMIMADGMQLQQVFLNLVLNAGESMPAGGTLTVATSSERSGGMVRVVIADTGKGIPQEMLQRIFDPFFTTKPKGTGLGLAITKRLVEQHNGGIRASNNEGGGASFVISLPVERPPEAA